MDSGGGGGGGGANRLLDRIPCPTVFWVWDRVANLVFCSGTQSEPWVSLDSWYG